MSIFLRSTGRAPWRCQTHQDQKNSLDIATQQLQSVKMSGNNLVTIMPSSSAPFAQGINHS